jgi:hypothetical protein
MRLAGGSEASRLAFGSACIGIECVSKEYTRFSTLNAELKSRDITRTRADGYATELAFAGGDCRGFCRSWRTGHRRSLGAYDLLGSSLGPMNDVRES